jgi:hypothetical protein
LASNSTLLALGLALAAVPGFAADEAPVTAAESGASNPDQHSRERAKEANEAAVNDAVNAVIEANRLDLVIRLIGRTSITIASGN